jgi:predicted oxidoreductase
LDIITEKEVGVSGTIRGLGWVFVGSGSGSGGDKKSGRRQNETSGTDLGTCLTSGRMKGRE